MGLQLRLYVTYIGIRALKLYLKYLGSKRSFYWWNDIKKFSPLKTYKCCLKNFSSPAKKLTDRQKPMTPLSYPNNSTYVSVWTCTRWRRWWSLANSSLITWNISENHWSTASGNLKSYSKKIRPLFIWLNVEKMEYIFLK